MLSAKGLQMKVADNVIRGDRGEPLYRDVVVGGVRDAVDERHELEEYLFVSSWWYHGLNCAKYLKVCRS